MTIVEMEIKVAILLMETDSHEGFHLEVSIMWSMLIVSEMIKSSGRAGCHRMKLRVLGQWLF